MYSDKVFYHGTDARIVGMPKEERDEMRAVCIRISDILFKYYEPLLEYHTGRGFHFQGIQAFKHKFLDEGCRYVWYRNLLDKLQCWSAYKQGNKLYRYESSATYLTHTDFKACGYANRARYFGEVGQIAHTLYFCSKKIFPPNFFDSVLNCNDVRRLEDFVNSGPEPVIIEINPHSLDLKLLESTDGHPYNAEYNDDVRYLGVLDLNVHSRSSLDSFLKAHDIT